MKTPRPPSQRVHGHAARQASGSPSPTYISWKGLRSRCLDQDNEDYGARGITYDPRWEDFELFLSDMGERPAGCTLDRIDPDKGYSKNNCRWASPQEQANNRRNTRRLSCFGRTQSLTLWARELGIAPASLSKRLRRLPVAEALTRPVAESKRQRINNKERP